MPSGGEQVFRRRWEDVQVGSSLSSHCKGSGLRWAQLPWMGATVVPVGVALGRWDPSTRNPEARGLPCLPQSVAALAGGHSNHGVGHHRAHGTDGRAGPPLQVREPGPGGAHLASLHLFFRLRLGWADAPDTPGSQGPWTPPRVGGGLTG